MKRKLLNGLLALAVTVAGAGAFSSCKDTNEDMIAQAEKDLRAELEQKVKTLQEALDALDASHTAALKACKEECEKKLAELQKQITDAKKELNDAIKANADNIADLQKRVKKLEDQMTDVLQRLATVEGDLAKAQQDIENAKTAIGDNTTKINQILAMFDIQSGSANGGDLVVTDPTTGQGVKLQDVINTVNALIYTLQQDLQALKQDMADQKAALEQQIEDLRAEVAAGYVTKEEFAAFQDYAAQLVSSLQQSISLNEMRITALENELEDLKPQIQKGVDAYDWAARNEARIEALEALLAQIPDEYATKAELQAAVEGLQDEIDAITTELNAAIENFSTTITDLTNSLVDQLSNIDAILTSLSSKVDALEGRMTAVETKVESALGMTERINDRLNKLVTGVLVQGTYNPVFGSFALPVGIQSNMLMAYTGWSATNVTFPNNSSAAEYNNELWLTSADMNILRQGANFKQISFYQGDFLCEETEGNAGTVYVTINPSNVDFTGATLPLVNSRDEESAIKLSALKKSDKLLDFGYSRADNGFYEAAASILSQEAALAAKVDIEPTLQPAVKEALKMIKDRKFSAGALVDLGQAIYKQFNGILPAYAMKAAWTAQDINGIDINHAVYSQYNLAATCFQPLSFKFLYDVNLPNLPTITPLTGFEFDLSQFTFNMDFPPVNINGVTLDFTLQHINIDVTGNIVVTIKVPDVIDNHDGTYTVTEKNVDVKITPADLAGFIAEVESSINGSIDGWNASIQAEFENAMNTLVGQIQTQVNDMLASVEGQINDKISDLIQDLEDEVQGKIDGAINKANDYIKIYNSVAERLNAYINNANNYLQVMMVYKGADGQYHQLSTSPAMPTPLNINGGDAMTFLPTTYTGEIAVPVYKKFIGVTNVWDSYDPSISAQNGDNICIQYAKDANDQFLMGTPVMGKTHRVPFKVNRKGYTYEIVYSALDYKGVTSTRKYYVTIK